MRQNVQAFAAALLDHSRTSRELDIILNHNPDGEAWEPGERRSLERLKLAIKYGQKGVSANSFRVKTHQTQNYTRFPVCCPSERAAVVGGDLVRRLARIPAQRHGPAAHGGGKTGRHVSCVQLVLYASAKFRKRPVCDQAIREIHQPLIFLRLFPQ